MSETSSNSDPQALPDPSTLTSEQRLLAIENYRVRSLVNGETLTIAEMNHAIKLITADRAAAQRERKSSNRAAQAMIAAPRVEDLI